MLKNDVLGSLVTTAREAAQQQPQGQLSTGILETESALSSLTTSPYAAQNLGIKFELKTNQQIKQEYLKQCFPALSHK